MKNLDLDDELEDYDGGNDYGDDDAGSYGYFRIFCSIATVH